MDRNYQTPLHWAAKFGAADIVRAMTHHQGLVSKLLTLDDLNNTDCGTKDDLLHKTSLRPNRTVPKKPDPLLGVAVYGDISRRVLLNMPDRDGRTPLHLAAMGGQAKVVEVLLGRADVDVDLADHSGRNAQQYAEAGGHLVCAVKLREYVWQKKKGGSTHNREQGVTILGIFLFFAWLILIWSHMYLRRV